jgi:3-deoxy-D-manno-octulosonic-acid transferase
MGAPVAVWVHAVSVGELLSARPALWEIRKRHPDWWVVLSTSHPQAYEIAGSGPPASDAVCWLPWDFGPCVEKALHRVRPDVLVLVECELWPNLIVRAAARQARIVVMNARIYERDLARYLLGRGLFAALLRLIALIGVQSQGDYSRFRRLGAPAETMIVGGNTKFDVGLPDDLGARLAELRASLPLRPGPIWVLASTHAGEEEQILPRCAKLWASFPGLQLLVAPRHIERARSIRRLAERLGLRTVLRSRVTGITCRTTEGTDTPHVIVLDTIGELATALGLADLVFVGGSLVDAGGHNPIEAALHAKAVLVGPSFYNFQDVLGAFLAEDAVIRLRDVEELADQAGELLADVASREALGRRAATVVHRHRGAAQTYAGAVERLARLSRQPAPPARELCS